MNVLSLFSGIGGVAVPVAEWIGRHMREVHNDGAI